MMNTGLLSFTQSTALGLSSLATISTLQNHLSLSSVPASTLPPVLDLVVAVFLGIYQVVKSRPQKMRFTGGVSAHVRFSSQLFF